MIRFSRRLGRLAAYAAGISGVISVAGCAPPPTEGIGFREARFTEMAAIDEWHKCRDEAIGLDHQAHDEGSAARYLAAARLFEKCEADVPPDAAAKMNADERLHAYALAVQDYVKGGDIPKARETLQKLKGAYPAQDLYLADGASFIDTMEFLTGIRDRTTVGVIGVANVDENFESEMRRDQYWKHN